MDYAMLSTLLGITILMLVISYDIACQWSKNLAKRVSEFPFSLGFSLPPSVFTVIPKFHIYAHGKQCQSKWSLNFLRWMARTDGEGVEREWSHINSVALSTRLMGPGGRHDTLDDHWGAWNWRKVVGLGMCFTFTLIRTCTHVSYIFQVVISMQNSKKLSSCLGNTVQHSMRSMLPFPWRRSTSGRRW